MFYAAQKTADGTAIPSFASVEKYFKDCVKCVDAQGKMSFLGNKLKAYSNLKAICFVCVCVYL